LEEKVDFQLTEQQETIVTAVAKICAAFDDAYWLDRDTTGEFPQDFAQAMARRLATVPGINANLPAGYGAGAFHYLLEGGITLGQMFGEIERELLKDERAKRIELSQLPDGTLRIRVFSHRADSYPLTLTIDAVNAAILLEQA
jgi:hypothetical protein